MAEPSSPLRRWSFLQASALTQMLSLSVDVDTGYGSGTPGHEEQAMYILRRAFGDLFTRRRPPCVSHEQPRGNLIDRWWCAGLIEAHSGTVIVVGMESPRDDPSLDGTLLRSVQGGDLQHVWLGVGTCGKDGLLHERVQTLGVSLLMSKWPYHFDDPQRLAMMDLTERAAHGELHVFLSDMEREQLLEGVGTTLLNNPRAPRARL